MNIFSTITSLFSPAPVVTPISFTLTANRVEFGDQIDFTAEIEKFNAGGESPFPAEFLKSLPSHGITAMVARKRYRPNARTRIDFMVTDQRHVITLPDEAVLTVY